MSVAVATVQSPAKSGARWVETRQYVAVARYQVFDFQLNDVVWQSAPVGPFPVLVGPGEPYRAKAAAEMLLPDGYVLEHWYPQGYPDDYCLAEF